jgi:hypothetical protein
MISPIDNLMKMFFQWKVDMLANITLTSIAQCMKFKLLYGDWVRVHPLKRSNQPVISSFNTFNNNNNNNKNKIVKENNNNNNNSFEINEYGEDVDVSEEEDNGISIDFTFTFSKYFDSNELRNQEEQITLNFQKLNVQPEVYIHPLSPDEFPQLTYERFEITKPYICSRLKTTTVKIREQIEILHIIFLSKTKMQYSRK